jgi:uncharacterized membrane protein
MARIEKSIEVHVPVSTAYDRWTHFEEFPLFMEGIQEVLQVDDGRLSWKAEVGGQQRQWFARITDQIPDEVVAWESEGGDKNSGVVTFHRVSPDTTEINLLIDYEPEGLAEQAGDVLGFVSRRVEGDLKRFKEFVEDHGASSEQSVEFPGTEARSVADRPIDRGYGEPGVPVEDRPDESTYGVAGHGTRPGRSEYGEPPKGGSNP